MDPTTSPIKLGSILFTLVEPHREHVVEYNRWYERDHFYAGCLIGPYLFAGGRYVATKRLKALRFPDDSPITGEGSRGSYLALYWVLDGHHDDWNRWALKQVRVLHKEGRMFDQRDHVHTQLYRFESSASRDPGGVPPELALDRRFPGLVAVVGTSEDREGLLDRLPAPVEPVALSLTFTPYPLQVDVPGVPRSTDEDTRFLQLHFLDRDPEEGWDAVAAHVRSVEPDARILFVSPFIPTVPGTDTYTDELW